MGFKKNKIHRENIFSKVLSFVLFLKRQNNNWKLKIILLCFYADRAFGELDWETAKIEKEFGMSQKEEDLEAKSILVQNLIEQALKKWAEKLHENRITGRMLTRFDDSDEKYYAFAFLVDLQENSYLLLQTVKKLWAEIEKGLNEVPMPDISREELIAKIREKPQVEPSLDEFKSEIQKWTDRYIYLKGNLGTWEASYARKSEKEFYAGLEEYGTFD